MTKLANKLYCKGITALGKMRKLITNERGDTNIIAIILILAIVIALAIVFRSSIMNLFNRIWGSLTGEVEKVL